jgi:aerobic-type carbon monoxide dehydrogenase small subunit (CoxS/CutS family)
MASDSITFVVNGETRDLIIDGKTTLLTALRQDLNLKGTRFGCGEERCGACVVLVDGRPAHSCKTELSSVSGKTVTTIEGLSSNGVLGPIQQAFIEEQAAQCGYCINGIIMTLTSLLKNRPLPERGEILAYLDERHLCRCGAHARILKVIDRLLLEATDDER